MVITIVLYILGVILITALGFLEYAIAHCPEGYEDVTGFHFILA
jgi:hypothetical protein